MSASNTNGSRSLLFLRDGHLRPGTAVVLFVGFGLFMGFGSNVTWWLRTGDFSYVISTYAFLFSAYHALTALTAHVLVLRARIQSGRRVQQLLAGLLGCMLLFFCVRWIGDQWLFPFLGERPNYPAHTPFITFVLDNVLYALLPIGFATLVHLAEQQIVQHQQRTELVYRERLSELDMLRARMAPHFLYNMLNNLYALSQRPGTDLGPPLMDLADLMRYIAKHQDEFVPIGSELHQVERFITLQALRYDRPLNVRVDVDDALRSVRIPAMLLLPLLENAFKHGDPCDALQPLHLRITVQGALLEISCINRLGPLAGDGSAPTGNHNLLRRLQLLFGESSSVTFRRDEAQRYTARLLFPLSS
ncbi:MAG: sensor histidine kinase [Flavobacteriales bacterium]